MVQLNTLRDNPGATHSLMRVGRGYGSGKGKTCGRGYKGQKSRTGVRLNGFEGGQMPLYRRLPKRGFTNIHRVEFAVVNLDQLQAAIDAGTLNANSINSESLKAIGLIRTAAKLVKVLSTGELKTAITIEVDGASESAVAKISAVGGKIQLNQSLADKKAKLDEKHKNNPKKKKSVKDEE